MKKIIVVFIVFVLAIAGNVSAQNLTKIGGGTLIFPSLKLNEGSNTVFVKELTGTLILTKKGEIFSDVIYKDASGQSTRLVPTPGGNNGAPLPECKSKLPDACFSSPDKNIGMCICKPGDISNGGTETYSISIVFQKVETSGSDTGLPADRFQRRN